MKTPSKTPSQPQKNRNAWMARGRLHKVKAQAARAEREMLATTSLAKIIR